MNENKNCFSVKNKNLQMESLRGISIIIIVLYHVLYRYQQLYTSNNPSYLFINLWGDFGVSIFLLITGYYLLNPMNANEDFKLIKFYLKKIARLWPTYALCITLTFIITNIWYLPKRTVTFVDYFLNLFFINGYINTPYVDGAHWYLTKIVAAIFVVGIIIKLNLKDEIWAYNAWMLLSLLLQYMEIQNIYLSLLIHGLSGLIGGTYVGAIVIGMMFRRIMNSRINGLPPSQEPKKISGEILTILFAILYLFLSKGVMYLAITILSSVVVYLCINNKLKFLNKKIFVFGGTISYSLYLIHQNIAYLIEYYLTQLFGDFNYLFTVLAFIVVVCLGTLIHFYIEEPLKTRIENFESHPKK